MNNKQEENEINLNKLAQYHRSSCMLEISGIPRRKQEDAIKLVEKVAQKAKIKDFHREQIVAHRTSASSSAPIIILFNKKLDRNNFFKQKKPLFSVNAEQIVEKNDKEDSEGTKDEEDADDEVSMPGIEENSRRKKNLLFLNESPTRTNRTLLKEAKTISKQLNYKFTVYTINGEVRVKRNENSEHIAILCKIR